MGLGAFVDGIVLHQVLQWHHLLSATGEHPTTTVAGLEVNTLADGLFHLGAFACTLAGLRALWTAVRAGPLAPRAGVVLVGWILAGWGSFNLVEGLVDHHLLAVHHVREGPGQLAYDLAFLAVALALLAGGWLLQRAASRRR